MVLSYLKGGNNLFFFLMKMYYSFFNDGQIWQLHLVFAFESQLIITEYKEEKNNIWVSRNKPITQIGSWIFICALIHL